MPITYEQARSGDGTGTSVTAVLTSTPASGSLLVLTVGTTNSASISSITNETWTAAGSKLGSPSVFVYWAISGGSNTSFQVNFGASETAVWSVAEYSADDDFAADQDATNSGSSTTPAASSITPSSDTRLHVFSGIGADRNSFASYSDSFVERIDDNNGSSLCNFHADKILTSAGSALSPTCTMSGNDDWATIHTTFEEVSSGINILRLRAKGY